MPDLILQGVKLIQCLEKAAIFSCETWGGTSHPVDNTKFRQEAVASSQGQGFFSDNLRRGLFHNSDGIYVSHDQQTGRAFLQALTISMAFPKCSAAAPLSTMAWVHCPVLPQL